MLIALIREEGFLRDLADLRPVLDLPAGAHVTLLTSSGAPDLFRKSGATEVWELTYHGRTLLSYDQTSEARRRARRRHLEVFVGLLAAVALAGFVIWLNRGRVRRQSAWRSVGGK